MTNSSPPEPPQPKRPVVSFSEFVAIIVAFTTIGVILFWSWDDQKNGSVFRQGKKIFAVNQTTQSDSSSILNLPVLSSPKIIPNQSETFFPDTFINQEQESSLRTDRLSEKSAPLPDFSTPPQQEEISKSSLETAPALITPTDTPETTGTELRPTATPEKSIKTTDSPTAFNDVPNDYWAYPFITALAQEELLVSLSGNNFQPDRLVTREQLAANIEKAFRQEASQDLIDFEDVSQNTETANKIDEAVRTGFLKGYPGQTFRPDRPVPRLQVLVALVSGLGLEPSKDADAILSNYQDVESIPAWAKEQIAAAIEAGLVVNRPGFDQKNLNLNEPATRAEVAATIHQGLVKTGRLEKITPEYIINTP